MDKQKSIEALQFFVTGLSEGAFVHKVQGQIFKAPDFGGFNISEGVTHLKPR